jgi:hypothetical protein
MRHASALLLHLCGLLGWCVCAIRVAAQWPRRGLQDSFEACTRSSRDIILCFGPSLRPVTLAPPAQMHGANNAACGDVYVCALAQLVARSSRTMLCASGPLVRVNTRPGPPNTKVETLASGVNSRNEPVGDSGSQTVQHYLHAISHTFECSR